MFHLVHPKKNVSFKFSSKIFPIKKYLKLLGFEFVVLVNHDKK